MAVCRFRLKNNGVYPVRVRFAYTLNCGSTIYTCLSGYINPGDAGIIYPDEYAVPDCALTALYADVMNGGKALASERFVCAENGQQQAGYTVCGDEAGRVRLVYNGTVRVGRADIAPGSFNRNCFIP